MARVLIVGGGIVGSSFALLAAKDGHEVTVVERDAAAPPATADAAWDDWERRGVNQFRLLHYFLARFRQIISAELPAVVDELEASGALRANPFTTIPDSLSGGWRPDDDRFETLTGRRPVVEAAFARIVAANPKITVRRGTAVRGLLVHARTGKADIPHVDGVVTDDGEELRADLVVDAGGRRSALPSWLEAAGARPPLEAKEDCGFVYYGRYFRSGDGSVPFAFGPPLQHYESFSTITLPADNGTWGIGVITSARDAPARALAHDDTWERVVRACPLVAHWLDGTSMQSVQVMAKIEDRIRNFVVDGTPVVTGIVAVGDAWGCTNPSVGRGATIGLTHALALRDLLRERERGSDLDNPAAFAQQWAELTETTVAPMYRDTLAFDRHRLAEIDAQIAGHPYITDDQSWIVGQAITNGSGHDPDLLRAAVDLANLLATPQQVLARPAVAAAMLPFVGRPADLPPGPSRADFLALLA
jgi:2-polyprenyl-6-methoxyphenol hydroxylase-like FAD-dependent oxidoreductase